MIKINVSLKDSTILEADSHEAINRFAAINNLRLQTRFHMVQYVNYKNIEEYNIHKPTGYDMTTAKGEYAGFITRKEYGSDTWLIATPLQDLKGII